MVERSWRWGLAVACLAGGQAVAGVEVPSVREPASTAAAPTTRPASVATGGNVLDRLDASPKYLAITDDESIYAPPPPPREDEGTNAGGVNFDIEGRYVNHYVYRGVDRSNVGGKGNSLNLQVEGRAEFNLGKFPHPFVGAFTNIFDSDPVSRFQEIRPFVGATLDLHPFLLEGGDNSYVYPEREDFNTNEVYGKVTFDDSLLFHTEKPIFSPYAYGAYDYERNNGWYLEAGVTHDFAFEDLGLVVTARADVAYILGYQQQFVFPPAIHDSGFQHYDVGLTASYSLNNLLNFSRRYGEFDLKGYLVYTGRILDNIQADNVLWGGVGLGFKY